MYLMAEYMLMYKGETNTNVIKVFIPQSSKYINKRNKQASKNMYPFVMFGRKICDKLLCF